MVIHAGGVPRRLDPSPVGTDRALDALYSQGSTRRDWVLKLQHHQHPLEGVLKSVVPGPTPAFLTQWVWVGAGLLEMG